MTKFKLLIAVTIALGATGLWLLTRDSSLPSDSVDARMENMRRADNVEGLAAEAKSQDIRTARRAVETMGHVGQKATKQIRIALTDHRPEIRQRAAIAYAKAIGPEASAPLAEVARNDKNPQVRATALIALGRARAYTEMETLLDAMNDEDLTVRRRAADAVTSILGRRYQFDPNASPAQRTKSINAIRKFWASAKGAVGTYYDKSR
ncbi:MAG: HEAT repeat domain-containing protein [bacterium]|nr:HEAT repeat domain-containing protein [bacterium]